MRRRTRTVLGDARPFIFKQQQIFDGTTRQQAEDLQLDAKQFASCLEASRYTQDILKIGWRRANWVSGVPRIFVLYVTDHPQEAVAIPGAFPYEVFKEEIDKLLQTASSPKTSSEPL